MQAGAGGFYSPATLKAISQKGVCIMEKLVGLINELNLEGVTARKVDDAFILEVDGLLEESFSSLPEMSECLNVRSRVRTRAAGSERLDEIDHAICDAARGAGLL